MPNRIDWEWDVEEYEDPVFAWSENGYESTQDILDHHFCESYTECLQFIANFEPSHFEIVLVCSVWNETEGVVDRSWAYLKDGKLPEFTSTPSEDGGYANKYRKVPKKFHAEVARESRVHERQPA